VRDAFTAGTQGLSEKIEVEVHRSIGSAIEIMSQEVRTMARELALSEFNAASQIRSSAVAAEVRSLKEAALQLGTSGAPGSVPSAAKSSVKAWWYAGGAFVIGMMFEALVMRLVHR
jgi:hypothetical protein